MKINLKLNKIKLLPYQCKRFLNKGYFVCMTPLTTFFSVIFFGFCLVEEVYLVVHGDDDNLGFIIFYVVNCY